MIHAIAFLLTGAITLGVSYASSQYYAILSPDDPDALQRLLILKSAACSVGLYVFITSIILIDAVTPGPWMRKVSEDAISSAMVLAACMLALSLIWVYS